MRKTKLFSLVAAALLTATTAWADVNADDYKLTHAFSVEDLGGGNYKKVYFSQGNLQYQGSTGSWRFAAHQYDYIGNNAGNTTAAADRATQSDWIDLFGWATSGNSASNATGYQPYYTLASNGYYGPSISSGEWTAANSDWGVVNAASLGSGWRTLTSAEWVYLFNTRTTSGAVNSTSNARYTEAKILTDGSGTNGLTYNIPGIILFPDDFDGSESYSGVTWGTINGTSDWGTTCTTAGWEALEDVGCVFLPATGYRHITTVNNVGLYGNYWSSTAKGKSSAYRLVFGSGLVYPQNEDYRYSGLSVRLVSETAPPTPATVTAAPTAISGLIYNGSAQALINAGTASGGTMNYSLNNADWSEDIPTATNAGSYTVYYMVVGDANHADYIPSPNTVAVTINKAALSITADNKSVTYGDAAPTYSATYSGWVNSETQAVLTGTLAFACDYSAGSDVDDYTITPSGVTSGNYTITFNTGTLTVNKADAVITDVPAAVEGLVYTGAAQTLISAGSATGGELQYKVDASAWSTDLPQATAIGDHTVYYKVVGDGNHNGVDESSFTVSIAAVTVLYDNTDPTTDIAGMVEAGEAYDMTVSRTIYADGYFNTICLPFAVSAGELSDPTHPLYGYTDLKAFSGAEVTGSGQNLFINIYVEDATEIAAGVPYLISYPGNRADIVNPTFPAAVCTATAPDAVTRDGVTFQGMFAPVHITTYAENTTEDYLFLGENNRLLWPNDDGSSMRGFRAYFIIHRNNIPAAAAPRGTAARIMQRDNTATGIEQVQGDEVQSTKLLRDGQLIIIRNGVEYNANGQMLK